VLEFRARDRAKVSDVLPKIAALALAAGAAK
jgi:hypothetical protein